MTSKATFWKPTAWIGSSLLLAAAGLALAPQARAQAGSGFRPHAYVGGSVGQPDWRNGSAGGVTNGDHSGTGLKAYAGYAFTPNLAIEAGGVRLGRLSGTGGDLKADGAFVDAVGTWPITQQWAVLGRVGVVNARLRGPLGSDRGTSAKGGLGVQYQLSDAVAVRGEWERYGLKAFGDSPKADLYTVGVNVSF